MSKQTEKMLSNGISLAREAGAKAVDLAVHSKVGTSIAKAGPKAGALAARVKDAVSLSAGIAIAKKGGQAAMKGGKAAIAVARKNPVAVAAGAVALAGIGVAVAVVRKRKRAAAEAAAKGSKGKPTKVAARNMRGNGASAPAKKAPAKKLAAKKAAPRKATAKKAAPRK